MAETITALSEQQISILQEEPFALLSTVDHESGAPSVSAISWLLAKDERTVRLAVDQRSRIVTNLKKQPLCTLTLIGAGSVHAVYASAKVASEALEGVPFKLVCFDLDISAVRDAMFYGARISAAPQYEKTYDKRAAEKLDTQVFEAMKKA